ncbi:Crp/Fnr family transcriptional regulator [Taklimakanibacter lacteus]|uniref:Crp/Fnr family transcriptional regulator n=1 Tax=Taklimakanibacter lacteus TaxID=2268456 RepID=UPI000E667B23
MKRGSYPVDDTRKIAVAAGTVLLAEGTTSGRIYVLDDGTLEVARGETQVALISEKGAIFGEMSLLLETPHTATVRALTPAVVHEFTDGADFLKSDPATTLLVARLLARRLHSATTYLVDLKRQYAGHGTHLAMVSEVLASLVHQQPPEFLPGSERLDTPKT